MRRTLTALAAVCLMASAGPTQGALESRGADAGATGMELVVFEANGCTYCEVFRQNVLPLYRATAKSRQAPIRFVNLSYADETKLGLAAPISIVPTVVLLDGGYERGRVTGYTGPESFLDVVSTMMGDPD